MAIPGRRRTECGSPPISPARLAVLAGALALAGAAHWYLVRGHAVPAAC